MAECTREEISETVESLVVELRGVAQPHEIAQLRELALDAAEAEAPEQLAKIAAQVESLRVFCLNRAKSSAALQLALPSLKRQRA
ncbi:MAG: hypothetical protein ACLQVI_27440 [Polyangiaceae bacterium]